MSKVKDAAMERAGLRAVKNVGAVEKGVIIDQVYAKVVEQALEHGLISVKQIARKVLEEKMLDGSKAAVDTCVIVIHAKSANWDYVYEVRTGIGVEVRK